jgi:hypothetical protein
MVAQAPLRSSSETYRPERVDKVVLGLPRGAWSTVSIGSEPAVADLLAKARLILKPPFDLPVRMGRLHCCEPMQQGIDETPDSDRSLRIHLLISGVSLRRDRRLEQLLHR